ncbi:MAG: c-type cytochrome domain-containing protein [Gemmataceae bacterium]
MLRLAGSIAIAFALVRPVAAADPPGFNAHVRPILKAYCMECHGEGEKPKGGLDLRLRRLLAAGGDNGPAFVEGKPEKSLLLERVISGDMPPGKKKLSAAEIAVLKEWIAGGAKVETAEPATLAKGFAITDEDRKWWAFQPVTRPAVPTIPNPKSKIENPIDAYLLKKLSDNGMSSAAAPQGSARTAASDHVRSHRVAADAGRSRCIPQGQLRGPC